MDINRIVAPLAGAWIEMGLQTDGCQKNTVAPLAGAWIEIKEGCIMDINRIVAPLAGAWIEMGKIIFW